MCSIDEKINKIINCDVICKIDEIEIIPRKDDLPNHYIKGNNENEIKARKEVIIKIEENIYHDHSQCKEKIIISKYNKRIVIDINCKKARYILKRNDRTNYFFLISGFKLRNRQIKKSEMKSESHIAKNKNELKNIINKL